MNTATEQSTVRLLFVNNDMFLRKETKWESWGYYLICRWDSPDAETFVEIVEGTTMEELDENLASFVERPGVAVIPTPRPVRTPLGEAFAEALGVNVRDRGTHWPD